MTPELVSELPVREVEDDNELSLVTPTEEPPSDSAGPESEGVVKELDSGVYKSLGKASGAVYPPVSLFKDNETETMTIIKNNDTRSTRITGLVHLMKPPLDS
mmetsp:Transcript_42656/g.51222  ORF Transcript_42656/g.51222 Transcript_42656/m.51222 type:complete len:102 (+) Transcript_42656:825-1130(+)